MKPKVGMKYFREMVPMIKDQFNYLAMEVQPLDQEQYAELKTLGLDAVMVYQETYHPSTYGEHHLRGNKTDFEYRLDTPDRLAKAGIDKIGIGALIGSGGVAHRLFLCCGTFGLPWSERIGKRVIRSHSRACVLVKVPYSLSQ